MYYIYKITNQITNKIYVGRGTVRTKTYGPEKDHYYGSGRVIRRSLEKYGKENHTKEILEYCETKEQVIERETFWIEKLDALNPEVGYNMTLDSSGFTTDTAQATVKAFYASLTEEQKKLLYKKRADAMREQVEKIRRASKEMWTNRSDEENQKIKDKHSESWTEEKREAQRKRLTGSKRKSNLEYMIDKYGQEEGHKQFEEWQERHRKACHEAAEKRRQEKLKNADNA